MALRNMPMKGNERLKTRKVPQNPEWLAEEWRERAACFAVLDTLQRYAKSTKGWSIMPKSTKDSG